MPAETLNIIGLAKIPSQVFKINLAAQQCEIKIYQKGSYIYCDLTLNEVPQWVGVKCKTGVLIKPVAYIPFKGDLRFKDLRGDEDPVFTGFGDRWVLEYVAE